MTIVVNHTRRKRVDPSDLVGAGRRTDDMAHRACAFLRVALWSGDDVAVVSDAGASAEERAYFQTCDAYWDAAIDARRALGRRPDWHSWLTVGGPEPGA